jgi:hypothetical protein
MTEPATSVSPLRVLFVLIGLVAVGIVGGALCAGATAVLLGGSELADFAGFAGAIVGAFLAPIAGFSLLRRVALGRAILWTSVGTVFGGLIGFGWQPVLGLGRVPGDEMSMLGPFIGFGIAAFRLWSETTELGRRRRRISKGAA